MNKRILNADGSLYVVNNKMIFFYESEIFKNLYPFIDFENIELVATNGSSIFYLKDKNNVYLKSYMGIDTILEGATPSDFNIIDLDKGIATCGSGDYYFADKIPFLLQQAEILSDYYQKVNTSIYYSYQKKLIDVDVNSFKVVHPDMNFARDKNHFFFRHEIVPEIDINSFQFLPECFGGEYYQGQDHAWYATDKNNAYFVNTTSDKIKILKVKSPQNFKFIIEDEQGYGLNGNTKFYFGRKVRNNK